MEKIETTHILLEHKLVIYQRERSKTWQCRFKVDGIWQRASTNEYELDKAKESAQKKLIEAELKKRMNLPILTRKFRDVAKFTITRFENDAKQNIKGAANYKEYAQITIKYFIPFFGNYNIDKISYELLEEFDLWREEKMGKAPKYSTILNHNAVLNHIFNEAIKRKYLNELDRPKLITKGKKSNRRPAFNLEEARALKANFDAWINIAEKKISRDLRALLKEYVIVLLDTGARPGVELLDMKWKAIRHKHETKLVDTGVRNKENKIIAKEVNDSFVEMYVDGKTGGRAIIGRVDTIEALERLLKIQGRSGLESVTESNSEGYVFRLKNGNKPQSFQKLFEQYLSTHNLLIDPQTNQKRVFYSLRHTYATFALLYDKVPIHTLAEQMGTSVEMIEQHYSHLKVKDAVPQLKGAESRSLLNTSNLRISPIYQPKNKEELKQERRAKLQEAGRKSGIARRTKKAKLDKLTK